MSLESLNPVQCGLNLSHDPLCGKLFRMKHFSKKTQAECFAAESLEFTVMKQPSKEKKDTSPAFGKTKSHEGVGSGARLGQPEIGCTHMY